jgi:RNA polymerase sigma factor (sigma-70 family)
MKCTNDHLDKYIGLILYIIKKHTKLSFIDHYDLLQSGMYGLAEGLKKYDKNKGKESTWVFKFIRSAVIKARYLKGKEYKEVNGYDPSIEGFEENMDIMSPDQILIDKENNECKDTKIKLIKKILNSNLQYLTKDNNLNRNLYRDYTLKRIKVAVLADKYKLTKCSIWHRITKVNKLLKKEYLKKEIKDE